MKKDYGTASHEEIMAGYKTATKIANTIRAVKNPAVRDMIKQMIAMINIELPN
jgi:hypothetical protein